MSTRSYLAGFSEKADTHEKNQSIWLLVASPTIWMGHFLACYLTAAIWCAKYAGPDRSLGDVRGAIGVFTFLALVGITYIGWVGYRRHGIPHGTILADGDTPEDRHRFLGFATLLLSGLSALATLFVGLAAYFIGSCN